MSRPSDIAKELWAIRALSTELAQRTSSLEEKLAPVQGRASRKGKPDIVQQAIDRRNKRIRK